MGEVTHRCGSRVTTHRLGRIDLNIENERTTPVRVAVQECEAVRRRDRESRGPEPTSHIREIRHPGGKSSRHLTVHGPKTVLHHVPPTVVEHGENDADFILYARQQISSEHAEPT